VAVRHSIYYISRLLCLFRGRKKHVHSCRKKKKKKRTHSFAHIEYRFLCDICDPSLRSDASHSGTSRYRFTRSLQYCNSTLSAEQWCNRKKNKFQYSLARTHSHLWCLLSVLFTVTQVTSLAAASIDYGEHRLSVPCACIVLCLPRTTTYSS
jgi:hypothetical protein